MLFGLLGLLNVVDPCATTCFFCQTTKRNTLTNSEGVLLSATEAEVVVSCFPGRIFWKDSMVNLSATYCWWQKFCTSWYYMEIIPILSYFLILFDKVSCISTGSGFTSINNENFPLVQAIYADTYCCWWKIHLANQLILGCSRKLGSMVNN